MDDIDTGYLIRTIKSKIADLKAERKRYLNIDNDINYAILSGEIEGLESVLIMIDDLNED